MKTISKTKLLFIISILGVFILMGFASFIEGGFGKIDISTSHLETDNDRIGYKLYRPKTASPENPAPGVLLLHGYQNDKETNAAYAIELARRGIVALSIDEYGHGYTSIPMRDRGYTNYKISNLDKKLSGPNRFLTMMGFSTLDFFHDDIKSEVVDSAMGGNQAYDLLKSFDFVDESRLGLTGHSMGTWSSWTIAAHNPDHKAVVLQCGEVYDEALYDSDKYDFNNFLLLQAKYDEFDNFRDYELVVDGLEKTPLRYDSFMGQDSPVKWNETYGDFTDGSARRMELLNTNHRLTTHYGPAIGASMDWFTKALEIDTDLKSSNQIFMIKEILVLLASLLALGSTMPLLLILIKTSFFSDIVQPLDNNPDPVIPKKSWWKNAIITIVLSAITYPFITQLGHGLIPFPENIFRMTIGNGFITWLSTLMIISLIMLIIWYKFGQGKKLGMNLGDLGLARKEDSNKIKCTVIIKSFLLALILSGTVYILVTLTVLIFGLDFRFIWPFFKPFTGQRAGQFLVYLPFYLAFFMVNAGAKLYGQMAYPEKNGQVSMWLRSVFVLLGGIFLIVLLEYIPFFAGIGPGADLLFGATFGGPFMSIMILMIPQFIVLYFLTTFYYRKTGLVYVGSMTTAILASWIIAGGSALF